MPRAGSTPMTPSLHKQSLAFGGLVLQQLPLIPGGQMQYYIRNPKSLRNMLERAFELDMIDTLNQDLIHWQIVYVKLFGKTPSLSGIRVPQKPEDQGPMRLIVVAKEILDWTGNRPLQGTMNVLKNFFTCGQGQVVNLDAVIVNNDRDLRNGSYAIWVKDVREADEKNANKSAKDLATLNHLGLTLLERILLEVDYYLEHGEHLDVINITLCSGSRVNGNEDVPLVDSGGGWFDIDYGSPTGRSLRICSRSVYL